MGWLLEYLLDFSEFFPRPSREIKKKVLVTPEELHLWYRKWWLLPKMYEKVILWSQVNMIAASGRVMRPGTDVLFFLRGKRRYIAVWQEADGYSDLLEYLPKRFPGFNLYNYNLAGTTESPFLCWSEERPIENYVENAKGDGYYLPGL